jgi:hypothetical protein
MPTLTLDADELRALCDLLSDVTRHPNRFPLLPRRRTWLSALEKLTEAAEAEARARARQEKGLTEKAIRSVYSAVTAFPPRPTAEAPDAIQRPRQRPSA